MTLRYARLFSEDLQSPPTRAFQDTARKGTPRSLARAPPRRRGQLTILRSSCFPVSVAFLFFIFLKFFRVHVRIFFCTHFRLFDFSILNWFFILLKPVGDFGHNAQHEIGVTLRTWPPRNPKRQFVRTLYTLRAIRRIPRHGNRLRLHGHWTPCATGVVA